MAHASQKLDQVNVTNASTSFADLRFPPHAFENQYHKLHVLTRCQYYKPT